MPADDDDGGVSAKPASPNVLSIFPHTDNVGVAGETVKRIVTGLDGP